MKKVLSIALVLCMLLALCVPLSVSAAMTVPDPATVTKTTDLFDRATNTGLDAYKGTPKMDETTGSIKDAEWDKALPLILNSNTKRNIINASFSTDAEYYLLWDETYLYILQECKNTKIKAANANVEELKATKHETPSNSANGFWCPWNGTYTGTVYNVVLPSAISDASVYAIGVMPNGNVTWDANTKTGSIADAVIRVRYWDLPNGNYTNPGKPYMTYAQSNEFKTSSEQTATAGKHLYAKTQKTETGFMTETRISWAFLNQRDNTAFAPDTTTYKTEIGLKINGCSTDGGHGGSHINHNELSWGGKEVNGDIAAWDSVSLLAEKPERTYSPMYTPDTSYWSTALASSAKEFEIGTPERLLGLAYYLSVSNDNDQKLTTGKIFKLTANIDLNPGQDWAKIAAGTADRNGYWYNIWPSLDTFAGSIDGQGYTISGLFNPGREMATRTNKNEFGLIGRWLDGGDITNIVFDNCYMAAPDNDSIGLIAGLRSHNHTTDRNSTIENIYVGENVTISAQGKTSNIGGLFGGSWCDQEPTLTIQNVAFYGSIIPGSGGKGAITGHMQRHDATVSDFVYAPANTEAPNNYVGIFANNGTLNGAENNDAAKTRCYIITDANGAAAALAEAPGYMVETTKGVMPVKLADMMAKYKWQSTEADNDGKYSIRIVGEVASLAYDAVGFKVRLYKNGAAATEIKENVANTAVYGAVKAAGSEFDASTFNAGFMDGVDNKLFVITLDGLTDADVWKIEVTAVYTMDGKPIESAVAKTVTVSAYNPAT